MKKLSIGLRLTLSYLLVFAAAQFLFGFAMWFILRHSLYQIADDELANQVDDLRHFLEAQKKDSSIAKLQEEVTETYVLEHSGDYLQIYVPGGDWIYRASFMQKVSFPSAAPHHLLQPVYEDRRLGGKPFRFLSQNIAVHGRRFTVQTGIPVDDVAQTLALFRRYLVMFAPLVLLTASVVGYWLSGRALSPVDALTRTARTISGSNLGRRLEPLHTGDELQRLSDTLNEMLDRIESAFLRVTQFTADASHELRTPISLIRTEAEIALRRSRTEEEYRNALFHILMESETTTAMVEKLLSLARADSGREALNMRPINLRQIVLRLAEGWHAVAGSRALQFTENVSGGDLHVEGDAASLQHLLNILLDNAVKYTPVPGAIDLTLEERGHSAVLKVSDSGIGIAHEDQTRIFERFYRVDKARSRELGGAGLGLAIALWIVQQHHGSIEVESTPGKGSAFVVQLPLRRAANSRVLSAPVPSGVEAEDRSCGEP
jgi:two-component system, OmpR family, heavy metal sensor histidine kinase CusS